jgi:hypothetical protein
MTIKLVRNVKHLKLEVHDSEEGLVGSLPLDAVDIRQESSIKAAFAEAVKVVKAAYVDRTQGSIVRRNGWMISEREENKSPKLLDFVPESAGEKGRHDALSFHRNQYARRRL